MEKPVGVVGVVGEMPGMLSKRGRGLGKGGSVGGCDMAAEKRGEANGFMQTAKSKSRLAEESGEGE